MVCVSWRACNALKTCQWLVPAHRQVPGISVCVALSPAAFSVRYFSNIFRLRPHVLLCLFNESDCTIRHPMSCNREANFRDLSTVPFFDALACVQKNPQPHILGRVFHVALVFLTRRSCVGRSLDLGHHSCFVLLTRLSSSDGVQAAAPCPTVDRRTEEPAAGSGGISQHGRRPRRLLRPKSRRPSSHKRSKHSSGSRVEVEAARLLPKLRRVGCLLSAALGHASDSRLRELQPCLALGTAVEVADPCRAREIEIQLPRP